MYLRKFHLKNLGAFTCTLGAKAREKPHAFIMGFARYSGEIKT